MVLLILILKKLLVRSFLNVVLVGITAENLGKQYKITRKEVDEYALQSQKRYGQALAQGRFKAEISPVSIKGKKGVESFEVDEHPRPAATIEGLQSKKYL